MTPALIVALTIWLEAGGEGLSGRVAVAQVIQERARLEGRAMWRVCLTESQFSCWNTRTPSEYRNAMPVTDKSFRSCLRLARFMSRGGTIGGNFTHYHATSVRPWWAENMGTGTVICNQVFYTDAGYTNNNGR
jgi:N-acetylmuramoyl-L-alanine amidase